MFPKNVDGRIDDANAGWKGRSRRRHAVASRARAWPGPSFLPVAKFWHSACISTAPA
jgi:hypothetical protein